MKGSKICVSIYAGTASELLEKISKAAGLGLLIEIRFDGLLPGELNIDEVSRTLSRRILEMYPEERFVFTFRSLAEGGMRELAESERSVFWENHRGSAFSDVELDIAGIDLAAQTKRIVSYHDFSQNSDLDAVSKRLSETEADIYKIAITVEDAAEAVDVWKTAADLRKSKPGKQSIAIAMGEAGKWTRILGPAFGAPWTYASFDSNDVAAPGQITYKELRNVFRVEDLNNETGIFGVVSGSSATSLSPYMHNAAFAELGQNAVYLPFEVKDLAAFIKRMVRPSSREIDWSLRGFSVTNPHKQAVIEHLDFLDASAEPVGAVNTVSIVDGHLVGFNTDADGFLTPLKRAMPDLNGKRVAVFGAGGASRACIYALITAMAKPTVFARDQSAAEKLAFEFGCDSGDYSDRESAMESFDIAVNATTLGSKGQLENESPLSAAAIKNLQIVYDLVYNPYQTLFLSEAAKAEIPSISGYEMLVEQGIRQFEIWTGTKAPLRTMSQAILSRLG